MSEPGYVRPAPATLQRGKLSNGAVLFQSVSQIAPAGGIATVAIIGANFAGGALTLATIVSVVACLLTALSVAQLARYLPSAGSLGTYVSRGLGGGAGFVTGWMYAISELLIVSFVALLLGTLVAGVGSSEFGWPFTATWVVTVVVMYLLVAVVHELGVSVSTRIQQVISTFEVLLFVVLSVTLIVKAGGRNSGSVFGTAHGNVSGYLGAAGLFYILVNLGCAAYFLRYRRDEFGWLRHLTLPLLGAAVFVPVLLSELGIPAFGFISKLHAPLVYGAYAAVAIAAAATAFAACFALTRPAWLSRLGAAFDEPGGEGETAATDIDARTA